MGYRGNTEGENQPDPYFEQNMLGAQEAVDLGLCDAIGTLHDALAWLHDAADKRKAERAEKQKNDEKGE